MRSGKKQAGKITLQICIAAVSITCLVFFIHQVVTRRDDVVEAVRVTLSHPMLIVVEFSLMSCGVAVEAAQWLHWRRLQVGLHSHPEVHSPGQRHAGQHWRTRGQGDVLRRHR